MLNHLNGDAISDFVLRRRNKGKNGELDVWADYSINATTYIGHPVLKTFHSINLD
jgi:hypothetical protein